MLWVGVQMNLKTNIEATKEKYEGPAAGFKQIRSRLWLKQACLCDSL